VRKPQDIGHTRIEEHRRYLGVEADDAPDIAESIEVRMFWPLVATLKSANFRFAQTSKTGEGMPRCRRPYNSRLRTRSSWLDVRWSSAKMPIGAYECSVPHMVLELARLVRLLHEHW